jgi:redox-sensitive bicupin YhaK (pirin superfamily)
MERTLERIVSGLETSDGAGVKLTRLIGQELHARLDPFLMLDFFRNIDPEDYIAGFPDHPHRGFETVTLMLAGRMRHRDNKGNEGLLESGGVQWMTAGRGIVHSEMPEQEDGLMEGFQLWINLPSKRKMCDPWYRDIPASGIPSFSADSGAKIRVIAGKIGDVEGAMAREDTEPLYLDVELPEGAEHAVSIPSTHNAFIVPCRGDVEVSGRILPEKRLGILSKGDGVTLKADRSARFILVAGKPLKEPVVQYGPFVMNTQEEVFQALADFRDGRF